MMDIDRFLHFEAMIGSAAKSIQRLKALRMDAFHLSAAHTSCLTALLRAMPAGLTQTELRRSLGMDRAQVSRVLSGLCERGYVCGDGSGYKRPYRLTENGLQVSQEIDSIIREVLGYVSGSIPPGEIERFYQTFSIITENLSRAVAVYGDSPESNEEQQS